MKIIVVENEEELSLTAAQMVCTQLRQRPESLLVFPTGSTPLGMFDEMVKKFQKNEIRFSSARLVELDEYFGIPLEDPRNLFCWLERAFLQNVDFLPQNIYRIQSDCLDENVEAQRIENLIFNLGGIDMAMLGLGPNGHIGFNEPGSPVNSRTRVIQLSPESVQSNARYWGDPSLVPVQGITLGMQTLLSARQIVLLVQGESKAQILHEVVKGPVTEEVPASLLRTTKNFTILADREAAALLAED